MFEASNSGEATNCGSCNMDNGDRYAYPYKFQLEYDVQRLQQHLQEEMELHAILENAFEHTSPSSSGLSSLPQCAKELLSSIATLEITVSKLEQEMVSLHFQLSQERNERRLVEYRLKHSPFSSLSVISEDNMKKLNAVVSGALVQEKRVSTQGIQHSSVGSLTKKIPVNDLCIHPNRLSEEMVRCMKDIFISLADSSCLSSASTVIHDTPLSPYGHLSYSSLWSSFERSTILSLADSPKHDLQCVSQLLPAEKICDPYNVRGKLSWANIGNYGLAVEVSWMSVGKKQLEYAAGALQKFRSLVEQLVVVNPNHLNCNEKLAFWINLYNALSMHAYLAYGVPRSELKLFSLMQKVAYTIGGHSVSAAAIEYVILRMNPPVHRPQTALLLALNKLKVPEEQRSFSIDTAEPLVVFALSCGMYSSPAVQIYTAKNVRTELQEAQRDFIRASVGMSSDGRLLVPKLAHCFARNFIDDAILAVWISSYLPPEQATFIEQCMSKRRQSFLGSHNCGILPFDSRFRYLFLPDEISS